MIRISDTITGLNVLVASDSFKGCLSSEEVSNAIKQGILRTIPDANVHCISISDGGEGLLQAIPGIDIIRCIVHGPRGRLTEACFGVSCDTAVIESAQAIGLMLISENERNPMQTSSHGLGELILSAHKHGCSHYLIGLGGSSTNDAGTGMLQALGWHFYCPDGTELSHCDGYTLGLIHSWSDKDVPQWVFKSKFTIVSDVDSPFSGPDGAAMMFSIQKGASPDESVALDKGLKSFSNIIQKRTGFDVQQPGAGAAGGIGGAILAFLNGSMKNGINLMLDINDFESALSNADLVITGEGRIDKQTSRGKVPSGILDRVRRYSAESGKTIPVIAVCGSVEPRCSTLKLFNHILITSPVGEPLSLSMDPATTSHRLSNVISRFCQHLRQSH